MAEIKQRPDLHNVDIVQAISDEHVNSKKTPSDEAYSLPGNEREWGRLDKQHEALVLAMGITPCQEVVDDILAPTDGRTKRVLDIGCGTGIWSIQMAQKYPHVSFLGVDISRPAPTKSDSDSSASNSPTSSNASDLYSIPSIPENVEFEIENVNHGLKRFEGQFDIVYMRCVTGGIHDFQKTMGNVVKCLRPGGPEGPGGLVVIIEGDAKIYDEDRLHPAKLARISKPSNEHGNETEGDPEGSWFAKVIREACEANRLAGADIDSGQELVDRGLWSNSLCDPSTASSGHVYIPIGAWPVNHAAGPNRLRLERAGIFMKEVFLRLHRAFHPVLLKHGIAQNVLDEWAANVDNEFNSVKMRLWTRYRFCWARRRADAANMNDAQIHLPLLGAATSGAEVKLEEVVEDMHHSSRYPYFYVFNSAEEAALDAQRRKDAADAMGPVEFEVRKVKETVADPYVGADAGVNERQI